MEQHPVPRNITGFQFHLIGDMTFKQFGYLLAGGIIGYGFIAILHSYVGWGIGLSIFAIGAAFAFIPIQERPLDKWFAAFIKSIMSPTQFLWKKSGDVPDILIPPAIHKQTTKALPQQHLTNAQESKRALDAYLARLPKTARQTIDIQESKRVSLTLQLFNTTANSFPTQATVTISQPSQFMAKPNPIPTPPPPSSFTPPTSPIPSPQPVPPPIPPIKKEDPPKQPSTPPPAFVSPKPIPTSPIVELMPKPTPPPVSINVQKAVDSQIAQPPIRIQSVERIPSTSSQPPANQPISVEQQLQQLMAERDRLNQELAQLKTQVAGASQQVVRPTNFVEEKKGEETVKIISAAAAPGMGFPTLPTTPNIISGVIKDRNGTTLPNILVTVKDKFQTPVRALKTNAFGQFTTTTPLPAGVYTIELEDPQKKYTFAIIELTLTGDLVSPIEITAKSQKELVRDKLMKEVFGT